MDERSLKDGALDSLVARVADEFAERRDRGERPDPEEYARRHPEAADLIRGVLGVMNLVGPSLSGDLKIMREEALTGTLGDFRILREVGRGGMGVVYEAEQISLRRKVALKVLPFAAMLDAKRLQRFENEARAAASLHHEHIVPVHAVGCERGMHFYAMQFINGRTLAQVIDARRLAAGEEDSSLTPAAETVALASSTVEQEEGRPFHREVARLGAEAALALEHAHSLGVVHRDVKPANLMVDGRGKLWVTDFGLARLADGQGVTVSGDLLGTLRYMSPEQGLGRAGLVDHRSDVYSLGVTLYELLTLRPAVAGKDRQEVLRNLTFGEAVSPRRLDASIPADLETVLLKATAREPAERYASARELADDLRRFLDDAPVQARRPGLAAHALRWARRRIGLVMLVALSLVLASVALAVAALYYAEAERGKGAVQREEVEKFHRLLSEMRETLRRREPGWTWDVLREVEQAVALPEAAGNQAELRSLAAACLGAVDLRQGHVLAEGFTANHAVFSPDGKRLALVQGVGDSPEPMRVRLFDTADWRELPPLTFPSAHAWQVTVGRRAECANAAAFSTDGRFFAVGMRSGNVHVWDLREPAPKPTSLGTGAGSVRRLVFSQDNSKRIYALTEEGQVHTWVSYPPWRKEGVIPFPSRPPAKPPLCRDVFVAPPSAVLAVAEDNRCYRHDGRRFLLTHTTLPNSVGRAAGSPDGRTIAFHGSTVGLFDSMTQLEGPELQEGKKSTPADGMAFSPDGRLLARTSDDGALRLWDVASGRLEATVFVPGLIDSVAFAPGGRWLAVTARHRAVVFEMANLPALSVGAFHGGPVRDVTLDAEGGRLACVSRQDHLHEVSWWPLARSLPLTPDHWAQFSEEASDLRVALGSDRNLYLGSGSRLQKVNKTPGNRDILGPFGGAGGLCCDGEDHLWAATQNAVRRSLAPDQPLRPCWTNPPADQSAGHSFRSVKAGRRWALAGRRDGRVLVFDAEDGRHEATWQLGDTAVSGLALAGDESTALVGTEAGKLFLVEVPAGRVLHELKPHGGPVTGVGFASTGLLATGSRDRTVKLWRADGTPLLTLDTGKQVERLSLASGGRRLAVVLEGERAVRLWHLDVLGARLEALGLPLGTDAPVPGKKVSPRTPRYPVEHFAGKDLQIRLLSIPLNTVRHWVNLEDPPDLAVPGRTFNSCRWTAWLKAPQPGEYDLNLAWEHGGARLWLDSQLLVDEWVPASNMAPTVRVKLTGKPQPLRVEYWQNIAWTRCGGLRWRRAGETKFTAVSAAVLFPSRDAANAAVPEP